MPDPTDAADDRAAAGAATTSPASTPSTAATERGEVFLDARGSSRALRLSWHPEADVVVLSLWRDGTCAGTFRMAQSDVADFVDALVDGLRDVRGPAPSPQPAPQATPQATPLATPRPAAQPPGAPAGSPVQPPARRSFLDQAFGRDETDEHATAS